MNSKQLPWSCLTADVREQPYLDWPSATLTAAATGLHDIMHASKVQNTILLQGTLQIMNQLVIFLVLRSFIRRNL